MTNLNYKRIRHGLFGVLASFLIIGVWSCDSDQEGSQITPGESAAAKKERILKAIPEIVRNLPQIILMNEEQGKVVDLEEKDIDWDFSNPSGPNFSSSTSNVYATSQGVVIVSTPGFGANSGGGVITAGSTTFDITATFCLSAGEEGDGAGLASAFTSGFEGVSLVIGIAGDFDPSSMDTSSAFGGIKGMALYVVFDDEANGTYDVLDFFNTSTQSDSTGMNDLEGSAFAYIIDIEGGSLYFSAGGSLEVSGGSINFDGEYIKIDFDSEEGFGEFDEPEDFETVSGSGTMGC
jgi:hypothetical protein